MTATTDPIAIGADTGLLELGRKLVAMSESRLATYLATCSPEDLDVVERAMEAAELEAGHATEAAQLARERESMDARYNRWWSDPVAFAHDAIAWPEGKELHDYQAEALVELARNLRLGVQKLRGAGGSAIAAIAVLWFVTTREYFGVDWKVATTASVGWQLDDYLWPEIHKWAGRLRWDELGRAPWVSGRELLLQGIKLSHGLAFRAAPGDAASIEGLHATQVLVVFDEAKGIRVGVFDAIEGGSTRYGPETGAYLYALALSTPGPPEGRFYDICRGVVRNWRVLRITLERALAAGQVSASSIEDLRALWGEDSVLFANMALGEFKDDAQGSVIPLAWVQAANGRWRDLSAAQRAVVTEDVGIDVARGGADRSVLIALAGDVVGKPVELPRGDGPSTAAAALPHVGLLPQGPLVLVDAIGVGASVYDAFRRGYRDLGRRVVPFIASEKTTWTDASGLLRFRNLRSASWYHLRQLLDPALGATLAIPPNDRLTGDLTSPRFVPGSVDSPQGILIEPKADIAKRLGRSTNDGDALVMAAFGRVIRRGLALHPVIAKVESRGGRPGDDEAGLVGGDIWTEGF